MKNRHFGEITAFVCVALLGTTASLLWSVSARSSGQGGSKAGARQEAERKDFAWTIRLSKPQLSYQQRYLVEATAVIPAESLAKRSSTEPFIGTVTVQDADGRRLDETAPKVLRLPDALNSQEIRFVAGIYLRSGNYRVTIQVEDPAEGKKNIWHGQVRVPASPADSLRGWEDHFPRVEFASDLPDGMIPGEPRRGIEIWPLAHPASRIPIATTEPVRIDLLLAGAKATRPRPDAVLGPGIGGIRQWILGPSSPSPDFFNSSIGVPLQIGSLLSMMDVRKGCVRVSVLDYRQNRVFWDRRDARLLNWDEVQETIWASARKTVDFSTLENWQEPAAFLRRQLLAILSDDSGSEPAGQNVRRIVVLICLDFGARPGSMIEVLSPNDRKGCQLYFFRLLPSSAPTGAPIGTRDGVVTEMLRRMRPRTLKFQDARELSNALSRFIGDLSK